MIPDLDAERKAGRAHKRPKLALVSPTFKDGTIGHFFSPNTIVKDSGQIGASNRYGDPGDAICSAKSQYRTSSSPMTRHGIFLITLPKARPLSSSQRARLAYRERPR